MPNKQQQIYDKLVEVLAQVPDFGVHIIQGEVLNLIDSEDDDLPKDFIALQAGATQEAQALNRVDNSVREKMLVNITMITKRSKDVLPLFREARVHVKKHIVERSAFVGLTGNQELSFQPDTSYIAFQGRAYSIHVMPLSIGYVENF